MKTSIYLFFAFCLCFSLNAEGQILKGLKKKVKEVAGEVARETEKELIRELVPCEFYDKNCIEQAKSEGKEVVISNESTEKGVNDNKEKSETEVKNFYESNTRVESIGNLSGNSNSQFEISDDCSYVAIPGFVGSRQTIFVNGEPGVATDKVFFRSFVFSKTGGHYAYMAVDGEKCVAVIDGKISGEMICQNEYSNDKPFYFNEDGSKIAFINKKGLAQAIVINGEGGPDMRINRGSPLFVRGNNVFYVGERFTGSADEQAEKGHRLYINNKPGPLFTQIRDLQVSRDGQSYAYIANISDAEKEIGGERIVVNGKEGPIFPKILNMTFDESSGKVLLYSAEMKDYMVDEITNSRYMETKYVFENKTYLRSEIGPINPSSVTFDSNRKRYAFITGSPMGHSYRLWVDGKPGLTYEGISHINFTGSGEKIVYVAKAAGKFFVVANNEEFGPFNKVEDVVVSEKGDSYAFLAEDEKGLNYYVNGKMAGPAGHKARLIFSPDGSRYAYANQHAIIVDGKELPQKPFPFSQMKGIKTHYYTPPPLLFSPKGNRLAYSIRTLHNGQYVKSSLVIDDKEIDAGRAVISYPVFSPNGKDFAYLQSISRHGAFPLWRLYINFKPGPIIGERLPAMETAVRFVDEKTLQVIGFDVKEFKRFIVSL